MTPAYRQALEAHRSALGAPKSDHERALVGMLNAWRLYAQAHARRFKTEIGDDGVLGDPWEAIGVSLLALLNGETGRLDCGSLDALIRSVLSQHERPLP